jgi:2-dehydro-3-deoxyphosphooctonate aldolase (KDO 8-P synthase)
VFLETHEDPANAPSDGPNMIPVDELAGVLTALVRYDALTRELIQ